MTLRFPGTRGYAEQAETLIPRYESAAFEQKYGEALHLLPTQSSRVLDVGAGSGVDAAWFAARGHSVVAVEPTAAFRLAGRALHPERNIEWIDDGLPSLSVVLAHGKRFDVVMLTAVWMHLDANERRQGMLALANLLERDGLLMMSLRHGLIPSERRMFNVSVEETIELAEATGLKLLLRTQTESVQDENKKAGVTWTALAFRAAAT
jgi:2-polyprenyl-3-methyl-5-hydroxy-6-metoxy-1,4-benzoquinol methylase